jgi:hypothetical protein
VVDQIRATPWWLVSIALHLSVVLILAKLVILSAPREPEPVTPFIVETPKETVIDMSGVKRILDMMPTPVPDSQEPSLVQRALFEKDPTPRADLPVEEVVETPGAEEWVPDVTAWRFGDPAGLETVPGVPGRAAGPGQTGPQQTEIIEVPGDYGYVRPPGGTYEGATNVIVQRITPKKRGNVLLIWVMDASLSMKDDQADVKERLWEMDAKFRELTGGGVLKQAVVSFGDRPQLWMDPTTNVDLVVKAMEAIAPHPPGTRENVMAALSFVTEQFSGETGFKKVAVLVDDDNADDTLALEKAIRDLKAARMTLYVINRECPFQGTVTYEPYEYVDKDGEKYKGVGYVDRGPETADPEVTSVGWGGFFDPNRVMSGFGIYDVARIAVSTGGVYCILGEAKADYDWNLMESYAPELVSRGQYRERTRDNAFKRITESVSRRWNNALPNGDHYPWATLDQEYERTRNKLAQADGLIREMRRSAIMPTADLEKQGKLRRWPANADLTWASLILAKYRLRQYAYAIEDFRQKTRSIPSDHHVFVRHHAKPQSTPEEAKDRQEAIDAMRFLADRHPRTPWGLAVAQFDPNSAAFLYGLSLTHDVYFVPFKATLVLTDGKNVTGFVIGEDKKNGTYTVRIPGKGDTRYRKDRILKVIKISDEPPPGIETI